MVVYPYLMNNGFILYKDILNPYQPILSYALAFFSKFFGYDPQPYKLLTICLILLTDLLIFVIAFKLFKSKKNAVFSTLLFVAFSIPFGANGLWHDLVQTPLILLSIFSFGKFLKTQKNNYFFWTFLFLTLAFFIKQQVIWFIFWLLIYSALKYKQKLINILLGNIHAFIPFILLMGFFTYIFLIKDAFNEYIFWTFTFPYFKASSLPGYILFPAKRQIFILLILTAAIIPYLSKRKKSWFIFGSFFSLLPFAYPRFDYFHLVPALGVWSLIVGKSASQFKSKIGFLTILLTISLLSAYGIRFYFSNWTTETRFFESNIYELSVNLKSIAKNNSDLIFIQNGPDQLYPLADIIPSKPWGTQFPWYMELDDTQNKIIKGLENERVKYILSRNYDKGEKYDLGAYKPEALSSFIENKYKPYIQFSSNLILEKIDEN